MGPGGRGPWRRSRDDRLFGGVAGGLSRRLGIDVTLIRIVFVVVTLAGGFGAAAYVAGWLLIPLDGDTQSIGARASRDGQGIATSLAFVPALVVTLVVAAALHVGVLTSLAWPCFAGGAGLVLVWRNCSAEEREWLRQAAAPIAHLGSRRGRSRWAVVGRVGLGLALAVLALVVVIPRYSQSGVVVHYSQTPVVRPLIGAALLVAAMVVIFGPWWLRLIRALVAERQARARAEDRADMAARVHDSVLQTLAMIQRASDQPQRVVQLARAQERELRAWLFDGEPPGSMGKDVATFAAGAQRVAEEVEAAHGVPVELVTVGDCPLDERLGAVLAAAREATVNAAKWSGAPVISLFVEVEPAAVSVFVRDRGCGFDPDAIAEDRRGVTESIRARMSRNGGTATVRTAPGEGTEVELQIARDRDR